MLRGRVANDKIDELESCQIFVFGSNKSGHHVTGSAKAAKDKFGAIEGQARGLQEQSYAICTTEGLIEIAREVNEFINFAGEHQELEFLVTQIGCGKAGHNPLEIAPLFRKALMLPNVFMPRIFWEYYWMLEGCGPDYFVPSKEWKIWENKH